MNCTNSLLLLLFSQCRLISFTELFFVSLSFYIQHGTVYCSTLYSLHCALYIELHRLAVYKLIHTYDNMTYDVSLSLHLQLAHTHVLVHARCGKRVCVCCLLATVDCLCGLNFEIWCSRVNAAIWLSAFHSIRCIAWMSYHRRPNDVSIQFVQQISLMWCLSILTRPASWIHRYNYYIHYVLELKLLFA